MAEAGVAFIQLVPSMRGFSGDVSKQMSKEMVGPAKKVGDEAGGNLSTGMASGMEKSKGKFSAAVGKIGDVLKTGLKAAGLAAGVLLVTGLAAGMEEQELTAKLVAQLGGSEWAGEMGEVAGNLYRDAFGDSIADTGEALRQVLNSPLVQEDATNAAIEAMTAKVLTFTDVMNQDLTGSVRAVSGLIRTGLVKDGAEGFDLLTRGIQQGGDQAEDLLEVFTEYPVQFQALGLSGADAMGLIMQGLKGGARDADTVADALKELAIRGKDASKASAEGFNLIGLNAEEMTAKFAQGGPVARAAVGEVITALNQMENQTDRNAASTALFGTKSEDLQAALTGLDLDTAASLLGDTEGATEKLGAAYDTAASKLKSFKRKALHQLVQFIGATVIPAVQGLISVLGPPFRAAVDGVQKVLDRIDFDQIAAGWVLFKDVVSGGLQFGDLTGSMGAVQEFGSNIRDLYLAAIKPMVDFLARNKDLAVGAITGIGVAIAAILVPALILMVAPMIAAAAPFLLIIAAAAALGAAIQWLYNNVEEFRDFVNEALPQVVAIYADAFKLIKTIVAGAVAVLSALWRWFGDDIISVALIAWNLISGVVAGALDIIQGIIRTVTALINGDWAGAWEANKQILSGAWKIITSILRAGFDLLKVIVSLGWRAIKNLFFLALNEAKRQVSTALDTIVGFFRALGGRLGGAMSSLASTITRPFRQAFAAIKSLWNSTIGGFGVNIPGFLGFAGIKFSVPKMHDGGIFDSGNGEGPAWLKDGEGVFTQEQMAAMGSGAAAPSQPTIVRISAGGLDRALLEWLRHSIRTDGRGDVQLHLGE